MNTNFQTKNTTFMPAHWHLQKWESVILISEVHEKQLPSSVHHHHHTLPHKKDNAGTPLAHLFVASNNGVVIKTSPAGGLTWMPLCCPDAGYGNAAGFLNQGRYQRKAQPPASPSESGSLLRFVVAPSRLPTRPPDLHPQQSGNRQKQKKKRGLGDKHGGLDTVNIAEV